MQSEAIVRPSTPEDILKLAPRLRQDDIRECFACNGSNGTQALSEGLKTSSECLTIEMEKVVIGMFGVAPIEDFPQVGAVWLLASDDLKLIKVQFLRQTRPWIAHFLSRFPTLTNMVDERNEIHIKWIKWSGFTFTGRSSFSTFTPGVSFLEFVKYKE